MDRQGKGVSATEHTASVVLEDERDRDDVVDFKIRVIGCDIMADSGLLEAMLATRPTLSEHACSTEDLDDPMTIPHLIEHIAIDLLVERNRENPAEEDRCFAGYTVWLDRASALARITLESADLADTQRAMSEACSLVNDYLETNGR